MELAETINAIKLSPEEKQQLLKISNQREASRAAIERARILLARSEGLSVRKISEQMQYNRKKVYGCLRRFFMVGPIEALKDLPRSGRPSLITVEAKTWLRSISVMAPKDFGYPHGGWTTELLQQHVQSKCESAGHACLNRASTSTIWEILNNAQVKPHRIRYCMEKRDPEFDAKAEDVLHVYACGKVIRDIAQAAGQNEEILPLMPVNDLLNMLGVAKNDAGDEQESAETVTMELHELAGATTADNVTSRPGTLVFSDNPPAEQNPVSDSSHAEGADLQEAVSSQPLQQPLRKKKKHFPYTVASSGLADLLNLLKKQKETGEFQRLPLVINSYDEKPGIQAIGNKYPERPPIPGKYPTWARDSEYIRHGTVSLLAQL